MNRRKSAAYLAPENVAFIWRKSVEVPKEAPYVVIVQGFRHGHVPAPQTPPSKARTVFQGGSWDEELVVICPVVLQGTTVEISPTTCPEYEIRGGERPHRT